MTLLEVKKLKKVYTTKLGLNKVEALSTITFSVEDGEFIAVMGESGSGKTTLLNLIASLDKPTDGSIILQGKEIEKIKDSEISAFRRNNLGFVFQDFNLLDTFSIKDNILLPLVLSRKPYKEMEQKLMPLVKKLGIDDIIEKFPYEVSGGQKQRAAIARALIIEPKILLADEPTGALDSKASKNILDIFNTINSDNQTIFMVTHSILAASYASRVLFIKDGTLYNQLYKGSIKNDEFYQKIADTLTLMTTGGDDYE